MRPAGPATSRRAGSRTRCSRRQSTGSRTDHHGYGHGMTNGGDEVRWESPDGGECWFEPAHFPNTVSRLFAEIIERICEGWVEGARRWGLKRAHVRWPYINGYVFYGER